MTDMALVLMPYVALERPSLALGSLRPALAGAGLTVRELYANLRFAGVIGPLAYQRIDASPLTHRLGEWTFAAAAFPDDDLRPDAYLSSLSELLGHPEGLRDQLLAVRELATGFVDDVAREVLSWNPRIVGCSSVFQQQCASLALLRRIRTLDPSVITMLGGGNCEGRMGWAAHRAFEWLDFVVSGEADDLVVPLCRQILRMGREVPARELPAGVLGPAHRGQDPEAVAADHRYARAERLDRLPVPDYDEYFRELGRSDFRDQVLPGLPIETSRGCWWGEKSHCKFCGVSDMAMVFRAKPADRVLDELSQLYQRYGIRRFMGADNIIETSYFTRLMPQLATDTSNYSLFYQTKANLTRSHLKLLARAGVRWIQPGIESLHDGVLGLLDKGASAAMHVQLLKWARTYGIWVMWNLLFGAPGEEDGWYAEMAEWLPLVSHLQPPAAGELTAIRYNRFSPYFDHPERFGLALEPYWAYAHTYPHGAADLFDQAYYFHDRNDAGGSRRSSSRPGVGRLMAKVAEWSELFYDHGLGPVPSVRSGAPALVAESAPHGLLVRDSRPAAVAPRHRLDGLEADVLRACDAASPAAAVARRLAARGWDLRQSELEAALTRLEQRRLVIELGDRFLSLVFDQAPVPYPGIEQFPAGLFLVEDPGAIATSAASSATLPAAPGDVPLERMFVGAGAEGRP
ncbi:MAG: RiPP maturation radical SAM C-methyltransferase [Holophagales bacterium]|nr:RiPP maturation radical SAM C-methyltransferase [Holophagales bacterium]